MFCPTHGNAGCNCANRLTLSTNVGPAQRMQLLRTPASGHPQQYHQNQNPPVFSPSPATNAQHYAWMGSPQTQSAIDPARNDRRSSNPMDPHAPYHVEAGYSYTVPPAHGGNPGQSGHHGTPIHSQPAYAVGNTGGYMPSPNLTNTSGAGMFNAPGARLPPPANIHAPPHGAPLHYQPHNMQSPYSGYSGGSSHPPTPPTGYGQPSAMFTPGPTGATSDLASTSAQDVPHDPNAMYCMCHHCVAFRASTGVAQQSSDGGSQQHESANSHRRR